MLIDNGDNIKENNRTREKKLKIEVESGENEDIKNVMGGGVDVKKREEEGDNDLNVEEMNGEVK
jgi:hypothetical protein